MRLLVGRCLLLGVRLTVRQQWLLLQRMIWLRFSQWLMEQMRLSFIGMPRLDTYCVKTPGAVLVT